MGWLFVSAGVLLLAPATPGLPYLGCPAVPSSPSCVFLCGVERAPPKECSGSFLLACGWGLSFFALRGAGCGVHLVLLLPSLCWHVHQSMNGMTNWTTDRPSVCRCVGCRILEVPLLFLRQVFCSTFVPLPEVPLCGFQPRRNAVGVLLGVCVVGVDGHM